MIGKIKVGLALSGGGYRAAAYHIGTLRKLREMNLLDKVDVISSNSGGSITAAAYCLNVDNWGKFEGDMLKGLKKNMIARLLFSLRTILAILLLAGITILIHYYLGGFLAFLILIIILGFFQYTLFPFSKRNEKSYRNFFVGRKLLKDLPKNGPLLVMNSTNMETGRPFIFATDQMGDSTYRYAEDENKRATFSHEDFPVARAIAASTCVPFAFSPVKISKVFFRPKSAFSTITPRLVDGGVYDNQGTHRLSFENNRYACDVILVSDAGNEMPFKNTYKNVLALLVRVSDVFMNRIKNMQMIELLYDSIEHKDREVAYQSLGWDPQNSIREFTRSLFKGGILEHVWKSHGITAVEIKNKEEEVIVDKLRKSVGYEKIIAHANTPQQTSLARSVGTNLTPLSDAKVNALINHAFVMTELQVKLYCPTFKAG